MKTLSSTHNQTDKPKAIVAGLISNKLDYEAQHSSLDEASLLLDTYGAEVFRVMTQNAGHRKAGTYIGTGKVEEIRLLVQEENISIVVINGDLKAGQLHTLREAISPDESCQVWDRTELILQIFQAHANTAEAKLQIKIAQLQHRGPELSGLGISMSQQAGGIGTRGAGETNTEIMQRHWKQEIRTLEGKLKKVTGNRLQQMQARKQSGTPTVSIVGYTNAGKSTLFNAVSSKTDKVEDALFATLDSSVSTVYLPSVGKEIYISDTIGFIQDLPTSLVEAFKSTLMETINADILLHTIDVSDESMMLKIDTVNQVLKDLGLQEKKQIYLLNKSDKITETKKEYFQKVFTDRSHLFISAKTGEGIPELITLIETHLVDMGLKRAKHLSYLDQS